MKKEEIFVLLFLPKEKEKKRKMYFFQMRKSDIALLKKTVDKIERDNSFRSFFSFPRTNWFPRVYYQTVGNEFRATI